MKLALHLLILSLLICDIYTLLIQFSRYFACLFCVLRRCCSHMRCSSTFVHSAPLCSRALHYPKNPAQFRILIFAYCGVAAHVCGALIPLYSPLRYIRAPCTTQKILRNFAFSFLCIAALLLMFAVLEYLCTLRSATFARLALPKKSCAISRYAMTF